MDSGRRSGERERGTPPFILGLRRTSRCRSYRRLSQGLARVILQDSEEVGVRAARRPITNTIRLLSNYPSTIALCGVPGPRATDKQPGSHTSGALILTLLRLSLHSLECPAMPRFPHLHIRAVLHCQDQPVNISHDFWAN